MLLKQKNKCLNSYRNRREHSQNFVLPGNAQNPMQPIITEYWNEYPAGSGVGNVAANWSDLGSTGEIDTFPSLNLISEGNLASAGKLWINRVINAAFNPAKPWRLRYRQQDILLPGSQAWFGENIGAGALGVSFSFQGGLRQIRVQDHTGALAFSSPGLQYNAGDFFTNELLYDGNGNVFVYSTINATGPQTQYPALIGGPIAVGIPTFSSGLQIQSIGVAAGGNPYGVGFGTVQLWGQWL